MTASVHSINFSFICFSLKLPIYELLWADASITQINEMLKIFSQCVEILQNVVMMQL